MASDAAQVGLLEVGSGRTRVSQICPAEIGLLEIGRREHGSLRLHMAHAGALEVRALERGTNRPRIRRHCRRGEARVDPSRVWLACARPTAIAPLAAVVGPGDIVFGEAGTGLAFPNAVADLELPGVRERMARELVRDPALTLAEVAFRVGFSDAATFSRAFKRWTGLPPGALRQRSN